MNKTELLDKLVFIVDATKEDFIKDGYDMTFIESDKDLLIFKMGVIQAITKIERDKE